MFCKKPPNFERNNWFWVERSDFCLEPLNFDLYNHTIILCNYLIFVSTNKVLIEGITTFSFNFYENNQILFKNVDLKKK